MDVDIQQKIYTGFRDFEPVMNRWKSRGETLVFTNGCFDILHDGHVNSLLRSAKLGSKLIIGLNSDESVRLLKGKGRPVLPEKARALILASMVFVDAVIPFSEETPATLIGQIIPDILVKGKEYAVHEIAGHETVLNNGGRVVTLDLIPEVSTTGIIQHIKNLG